MPSRGATASSCSVAPAPGDSPPTPLKRFGTAISNGLDALLPLIFSLQLYRSQVLLSTGLLLIWLALRLVSQAVLQRQHRPGGTPWAVLLLGLMLVNVRVVLLGEESSPSGPSDFLMVVLGLSAGAGRSPGSWGASLQWIGITSLPIAILLALHWPGSFDWNLPMEVLLDLRKLGMGGLNRYATLVMAFTVCATYGGLLESKGWKRWPLLAVALLGYVLCLRTGSRLALLAPPLALFLAYLITRARGRLNRHSLLLFGLGSTGAVAALMGIWWFVLAPSRNTNLMSDLGRLKAAQCWAGVAFSGENRFLYGIGLGDRAREFCAAATMQARGEGFRRLGHAHNTLAQILGETGSLGLLAVVLLLVVLALALRHRLRSTPAPLPWGPSGTGPTEAALGLVLLLLCNALATTVFLINPASQCLIGYLASMAFWGLPGRVLSAAAPSPLDQSAPGAPGGDAAPAAAHGAHPGLPAPGR
ncbi:MAG: O-antigen ligase family protein [Prochlorococcaceae cyanobacterium]|jgi:O-antigen ligase